MTYYLFEKDLTSNHVSYHYCFLKSPEDISFNKKSKIKNDYYNIARVINTHLNNIPSIPFCHKAITPVNKFIDTPYFHLSLLTPSGKEYSIINDLFKIKTDRKYCYFTKKIPDLNNQSNFKCGFLQGEFSDTGHQMKKQSIEIANKFKGFSSQILYAFDFDDTGNIIHDNINIEIVPTYSSETFHEIKNTLISLFPHIDRSISNKYDFLFSNYYPKKFHFHFKIKIYSNQSETVKFYRTYNSPNPYLS